MPGEVSHIENIMAKEYKERSTRRLRRSEDTTTSETSSEKENQHDTSSADRFEMQQEVSKVIAENNSRAFGASASASGTVNNITLSAAANYNSATNTSTNTSDRQAQIFAREVTEKATERLLTKVREERVNKIIDEYEEQNKHGFDNRGDGAEHVTGVYRWVDKVYHNQIINYGKRLMYEFLIPQPAAFHKTAAQSLPPGASAISKPLDPRSAGAAAIPTHQSLTRTNYTYWAAMYNATVEAPPEDVRSMGKSFSFSGVSATTNNGHEVYAEKDDIELPEGYYTTLASVSFSGISDHDQSQPHGVGANIGSQSYMSGVPLGANTVSQTFNPMPAFEGIVPVSVYSLNHFVFGASITFDLKLTTAAFEQWQAETFKSILDAYQKKKDLYDEALADALNGAQINPLFYRIIENEVIKKNCMEYLVGHTYLGGYNFIAGNTLQTTAPTATPGLDSYAAVARFMEQAFEWEIMSYEFYPFYWGAKAQWAELYGNDNDDPLFRAFLQAGMARVVATIRPGFEDAMMYYMATGQVWNGGTVPVIGDELYLSLTKDLNDTGKPVGKPWETRVPTTLTVIQKDSVGLDAGGLPCNEDCDDIKNFFSSDKKLTAQSTSLPGSTAILP